jgi:hypothetical protein
MSVPRRIALCLLLASSHPVLARTVYKCVDDKGAATYQDVPCAGAAAKEEIRYPDRYEEAGEPAEAATATDPPDTLQPPPSPPEQPARPVPSRGPDFFRCTRPDGSQYTSDDGVPTPYVVDGSVLIPPEYLYQPDGPAADTGASVPEGYGGNAVPVRYTWVLDRCARIPAAEACSLLRREHESVQAKIKHAFSDTLPELTRREKVLAGKLGDC